MIDDLVGMSQIEFVWHVDDKSDYTQIWLGRVNFLGYRSDLENWGDPGERDLPEGVKRRAALSMKEKLRRDLRRAFAMAVTIEDDDK